MILSLTADSEIMWDKKSVTCGETGDHQLVILESQLGGLTDWQDMSKK